MDITQFLLNGQSPDGNVRRLAEASLKQIEEQNFAAYVHSLVFELGNPGKPSSARRMAGLMLKNTLDAKDATRKAEYSQRWTSLDASLKVQVKSTLLAALSSDVQDARRGAAQVIAKLAGIELVQKQWPELIGSLLANMGLSGQDVPPAHLREATLETLGYVCEEIAGTDALAQDEVNNVLTAVVQGMNKNESNNDIRLVATQALNNALEFAQTNFENEVERNYLMTVVCEATLCPDIRVRQAALECLVAIASAYYEKLAPYMGSIYTITANAAKNDEEPVACQAIELWCTICEVENDLQEDFSADSETTNFNFIKQALPALVPMLLETLKKQDEDQDTDETVWNLSMAGGTCLGLVSKVVGNDVVPLVVPFVKENISNQADWRSREAGTFAFGSILEGPDAEQLSPLVQQAFPFLLSMMSDDNSQVKHTTAWTLTRILEFFHGVQHADKRIPPIVTEHNLPLILKVLEDGLKDEAQVAEKVCGGIYYLAQGYEGAEGPSPLSPYMHGLMTALLATAEREDAGEANLRRAAYEALNQIIRSSPEQAAPLVAQLAPVIMQKLQQTMERAVESMDKEKQTEDQALLCSVLQVVIQKLGASEGTRLGVAQHADQIMELLLRVFSCRSASVHEEAMMAIGVLADATGSDFARYMERLYPHLETGLQNVAEYQVCGITVGVVGDISRAIEEGLVPHADGIVNLLLRDLSSDRLHRSVKPGIFSCLGDIALAVGHHFAKYLPFAMPMLKSASEMTAAASTAPGGGGEWEEVAEYNDQLRLGILEAYTAMLQAFKGPSAHYMVPWADHILLFVESVFADKTRSEAVMKAAVGVLGDMADSLGPAAAPLFVAHPFFQAALAACINSADPQLVDVANWAHSRIVAVTGGAAGSLSSSSVENVAGVSM